MAAGTEEFSIEYEPGLVEATVLGAPRSASDEARFRAGRDAVYTIADPEEREARFRVHHAAWFERLGLAETVSEAIREQPLIPASTTRCLVGPARSRRDEGAELFVVPGPGATTATQRTVVLRLRPETLSAPDRLRALLRRELMHIADMLDPGFGYEPHLVVPTHGPTHEGLLRERYRALWDAYVDGRLARRGWVPTEMRAARLDDFTRAFPMLGERTGETFARFFEGTLLTHEDLVAVAANPNGVAGHARTVPHPGERCALCGCPTHAFEREPDRLPHEAVTQIRASFPAWDPVDGLCRQCADLYRTPRVPWHQPADADP